MQKSNINSDFFLGLGGIVAGCLILFVWIPLDVESGLIEKVRSQIIIGDAMAPTLAASVLVTAGLMMIFQSFRSKGGTDLNWNSLKFIMLLLLLLGISLTVMRWSGPVSAHLLGADYRSLRDTIPWKYIGYFLGGTIMVFGLISTMEHRMRWRILVISLLAVLVMMFVYDLPFKNLLLPPNGDM